MKSQIKQITLVDGKHIFYPTDEELRKVSEQIVSLEIIEYMTKAEYDAIYVSIDALQHIK